MWIFSTELVASFWSLGDVFLPTELGGKPAVVQQREAGEGVGGGLFIPVPSLVLTKESALSAGATDDDDDDDGGDDGGRLLTSTCSVRSGGMMQHGAAAAAAEEVEETTASHAGGLLKSHSTSEHANISTF